MRFLACTGNSQSQSSRNTKGWSPKGWFRRMFPGTKTGTRARSPKPPFYETALYLPVSLFGVDKRVVSKRVVSADVPLEQKPERGHVRQNHPFSKPHLYLPVKSHKLCNSVHSICDLFNSLLFRCFSVAFSRPSSARKNSVCGFFVVVILGKLYAYSP